MSFGILPINDPDPVAAAKALPPASKKGRAAFSVNSDGSVSLTPKVK